MSVVLPLMYAGNVVNNEDPNVHASLAQHLQFIENARTVFAHARPEDKASFDAQLQLFANFVFKAQQEIRSGISEERALTSDAMVAAKERMAGFIKYKHLYICSQLELEKADEDTRRKYDKMKQFLGLQYLECKRPCVIL